MFEYFGQHIIITYYILFLHLNYTTYIVDFLYQYQ